MKTRWISLARQGLRRIAGSPDLQRRQKMLPAFVWTAQKSRARQALV